MWGGQHVQMMLNADGATVEYDCAHGTIDEALSPDQNGDFDVAGTYLRESGGPVRSDDVPTVYAAQYAGTVDAGEMTMTVTLTDSGENVGTYTLTLGDTGRVFKCLSP